MTPPATVLYPFHEFPARAIIGCIEEGQEPAIHAFTLALAKTQHKLNYVHLNGEFGNSDKPGKDTHSKLSAAHLVEQACLCRLWL